jgi:Xaa-Pro aminopeptidase
VFSLHGCGPDAYAAIVGAGANGCILHYNACSKRLEDGDLIVMDYAPTLHGYCSDVTRTFPANGKFTPAQRKLVLDVYEIQQELIADVKPGARLSAIGSKCAKLLVARGYRNDHGPCHHVGLAVHDPSVDVLEEGMVLTVEPGAYLPDQNMGCRIEDTVLVTATGCEILSRTVPSHPDAIEAFMQRVPR